MKSEVGLEKLRGGYYTPEPIARFICNWAIDINTKGILEPSCGDGIFLKEAAKKVIEINPNLSIEDTIVTQYGSWVRDYKCPVKGETKGAGQSASRFTNRSQSAAIE